MTPFYTKTGDDGTTGLLGNLRVDKSDLRIEVLGSLDELTASLGLARSLNAQRINEDIKLVQRKIYLIMAEVAATEEYLQRFSNLCQKDLVELEAMIESYTASTKMPRDFILPGDTSASAAVSISRTVARRAERRLVESLKSGNKIREIILQYVNRLSSLLYIMEIFIINQVGEGTFSLAKEKDR